MVRTAKQTETTQDASDGSEESSDEEEAGPLRRMSTSLREVTIPPADFDPMDAGTYELILGFLGVDRDESDSDSDLTWAELKLRQDFADGKVRWTGIWSKDCWSFIRNNHPLFAMFCSHPLHPVSRCEHYIIHFFAVMLAVVLACVTCVATPCVMCDLGCGDPSSVCDSVLVNHTSTQGWDFMPGTSSILDSPSSHFCCETEQIGANWFIRTLYINIGSFEYNLGKLVYNILWLIGYMVVYHQMMMCNCVQHKLARTRRHMEFLGHATVTVLDLCLLYFCLPPAFSYILQNHMGWSLFRTLLTSKLTGWVVVLGIKISLFNCAFKSTEGKDYNVTEDDYNAYLDQGRGEAVP